MQEGEGTAAMFIPSLVGSMERDRPKRDEWSEGAVGSLLDDYEAKWVMRNRAKLKAEDWEDVARRVSARANSTKPPKTLTQCKNKIESMKKRYRYECNNANVSWPLFHRLDSLLCCRSPPARPRPPLLLLEPGPSAEKDPPAADGGQEARRRKAKGKSSWALARSIRCLADAMMRTETVKMEAMREMERARAEAEARNRELEIRRVEIIAKTQVKIARILGGRKRKENNRLDPDGAAAISVAAVALHCLLH
ncbi:Trihelix transcription factor [Nymphaea thermarum]|nr:Trihelix transcription factor [Nymphaea thermarum]